jgi:four helix bundle protein
VDKVELEARTKRFALRVIRFVSSLAENKVTNMLGYQLLKSGTSIGANYREANRAQSRNDFIHKIAIVEKEAAETQYWLELCEDAGIGGEAERRWLPKNVANFWPSSPHPARRRKLAGNELPHPLFAFGNCHG